MPQQPVEHKKFRGLLPGIDRKRVPEPFVVSGRDFIVDVDGPVAALSRDWIFYRQIDEPRGIQTLDTIDKDDKYYMTADAICKYDVTTRQLYPVFHHATRQDFWPWSMGIVGNIQYFANPEVGLLSYNPSNGAWQLVTGANIPAIVYACCESFGRLVLLGDTLIHWSAIDDGTNSGFTPSTVTGAGFQVLSILSSRTQPLMVLPYTFGFLTYTGDGVIRSEITNAANPFRHKVISGRHKILNPWCVVQISEGETEQHVFCTARGLYVTDGLKQPELWQPLMSEYLHRNIFPAMSKNIEDNTVRLSYSFEEGFFMVSIAEDSRNSIYSKAFILYLEEWGVYSSTHTGFGTVYMNAGPDPGFYFGVFDVEGTMFRFSKSDHIRYYPPADLWLVDYRKIIDLPPQYHATATSLFRTMMQVRTDTIEALTLAGVYDLHYRLIDVIAPATMPVIEEAFTEESDLIELDYGSITGVLVDSFDYGAVVLSEDTYEDYGFLFAGSATDVATTGMGMQDAMIQYIEALNLYTRSPLEAEITVGPFKLAQETDIDTLGQLHTAMISMLDSGGADVYEDYLDDYTSDVFEDWMDATGDEDWGELAGPLTEYTPEFFGTLDGYKRWRENDIEQSVFPTLVKQEGKTRYVAGQVCGAYIYLRITTGNLGEVFHLKHLRLNLTNAGQLF